VTARPWAVVAYLDSQPGLQTARLLAANHVRVIGVVRDPESAFSRTNSASRIVTVRWSDDDSVVVDALVDISRSLGEMAVLFPAADIVVRAVSRNREILSHLYHVALPDHDTVEMLMSKVGFVEFALRERLPIPPTRLLRSEADAEVASRELSYPCVLKPDLHSALWDQNSRLKVYKVFDSAEFLETYRRVAGLAPLLIASEWIPGGEDRLYSCNAYYDGNSRPLCSFVSRKLRQFPPETGVTSLGEEVADETVREIALDLFGRVGYRGFGYLEVKKSASTGQYYAIEANVGRPTGRSALAEFCGVDLVYTMYCDLAGLPLPEHRLQQRLVGGKWIDDLSDARAAYYRWRRGELTVRQWLRSLKGRKWHAIWSLRDPMPFVVQLAAFLRQRAKA
jgi:predicted ATP-grasp superfamily ATP-dependent carboligase